MAKVGRPTKYTPEACDVVVELGRDGASRAEMAAELDIAIKTLHNWEDAHPEFLQATTRARDLAQAWWERQGRRGIWSREFNASAYRLQVMNRFPTDWRDKQDVNLHTPEGIEVRTVRVPEKAQDANEWAKRFRGAEGAGAASHNGDGGG